MHTYHDAGGERAEFAAETIRTAQRVLSEPNISHVIGSYTSRFVSQLDNAIVADVSEGGYISLPEDRADDASSIVVAAVYADEDLTISTDFYAQTPLQRRNTVKQLEAWQPKDGMTAAEIYDLLIGGHTPQEIPYRLAPESSAVTGAASHLLSVPDHLAGYFNKAPKNGIAAVFKRPTLLVKIGEGQDCAPPDFVAHELVHHAQMSQKPIETYHSQKATDLKFLRMELEAYHVGAMVVAYAKSFDPSVPITADNLTVSLQQLAVEGKRVEANTDPLDPFRPSAELLATLQSMGINVIHAGLDYDLHYQQLEDQATFERIRQLWRAE